MRRIFKYYIGKSVVLFLTKIIYFYLALGETGCHLNELIAGTCKGVGDRGSTVVKVLRYKSEGRWFEPRLCHWNFSLT
jgi:hypothetical protein